METRLRHEPDLNIAGQDFIVWLHRIFYEQLPSSLRRVRNEETGETIDVVPGELRRREVIVGRHIGPEAATLPAFLDRFASFYQPAAFHGLAPLIAAVASHHRLMWIHPFLDGNGRVARLYTDAYFLPAASTRLWTLECQPGSCPAPGRIHGRPHFSRCAAPE